MLKILSEVKCRLQFELNSYPIPFTTRGECGDHFLALGMKRHVCLYYKYIYSTHCLKFKPPDIRFALKSSMHHFTIKIYAYAYSLSFLMNGPISWSQGLNHAVILWRFSCRLFSCPSLNSFWTECLFFIWISKSSSFSQNQGIHLFALFKDLNGFYSLLSI